MNLEYEASLKVTQKCGRGVSHCDLHTSDAVFFNPIGQVVVVEQWIIIPVTTTTNICILFALL